MLRFDVRGDVSQIIAHLDATSKRHVPFATAKALTKSAQFAGKKLGEEIGRVFDRPTSYTRNATRVIPATKQRLIAEVKIKDEAVKSLPPIAWLGAEIYGGSRSLKASEKLLQTSGKMPTGQFLVPTRNAPLDAYGNVSRGVMQKILSDCRAQFDTLNNTTAASTKRRLGVRKSFAQFYFSTWPVNGRTSHLKPGIWQRTYIGAHTAIRPVFLFASRVRYRVRLPFNEIVDGAARARFPTEFGLAMREALATAR